MTTRAIDVNVVLSFNDLLALFSLICKNGARRAARVPAGRLVTARARRDRRATATYFRVNGTLSFALAGGYTESALPYEQDRVPAAMFHLPLPNGTSWC